MLHALHIRNLAIAEALDIDFHPGMTVISGETGAGKSIMFDALGLLLGDKASAGMVRHGTERAEISANFEISQHPLIQAYLKDQDLDQGEEQLILRRVISKEGRSRAYVNGQPTPMGHMQWLCQQLVDIHGQHAHQSLLRSDTAMHLLDDFGQCQSLRQNVQRQHLSWRKAEQELCDLQSRQDAQAAEIQLLDYQLGEFAQLDLQEGEYQQLETNQRLLANAEAVLSAASQVQQICQEQDDFNLCQGLSQALSLLQKQQHPGLTEVQQLLSSAQINIEEAMHSLDAFTSKLELDEHQLAQVEDRLSILIDLARKHQIRPEQLLDKHQQLLQQRAELVVTADDLAQAENRVQALAKSLAECQAQLSAARQEAASRFDLQVGQQLRSLDLPHARFITQLEPLADAHKQQFGLERPEFFISMNPGQPEMALSKVASGGELSRISLAIQVICAQHSVIPTLVFDEVDVGISGGTAEVVGQLLRQLGERGQVLCITHQPQVAAQGHQHLRVSKTITDNQTRSQVEAIGQQQRTEEIARMLGGLKLTEQTWAHAREMLLQAQANAH